MSRRTLNLAITAVLVFWSAHWGGTQNADAQTPRQPPAGQQPNRQLPREGQPPPPTIEDILKLFVPPPGSLPPDQFDTQPDTTFQPVEPPQPRVPTTAEVANMKPERQRALLRVALHRLDEALLQMRSGAGWRDYLLLESLGSGLWTNRPAPPDARTRAALAAVAARFDAVAKQPKFQKISDLWGFQAAHAALGEYAIEPVDRSKRQVSSSLASLVGALDQVRTGASWKKYFHTDAIKRIAQSKTKLAPADRDVVRQIVSRLREVSKKPEFKAVARARGFDATRKALESLEHEVLQLDSSAARGKSAKGKQVLVGMADILRELKKAGRYKRDAHQACAAMSNKSLPADPNGKLYLAAKKQLDQTTEDANKRMEKVTQLIQSILDENSDKKDDSDEGTTVTLMQFRDVEDEREPETVTLMQFKEVEEEDKVEYVLMQFSDEDDDADDEKKKKADASSK